MNVGRSIHPAFQRKAMQAVKPDAKPRSLQPAEVAMEPALPPVHITQVLALSELHQEKSSSVQMIHDMTGSPDAAWGIDNESCYL